MIVQSFTAENFMSFESLSYNIPEKGLFFVGGDVVGGSANSNGAGKSSLFDAVCWGLYGETIKRLAYANDIIRRGAERKGCCVTVRLLSDDGLSYVVTRYRGHKKYGNSLFLHVEGDDITAGDSSSTQKLIDRAAGVNFSVFSTAVIFGEKAQRFAEAKDSEKKAVMDEILMLHRIQDALKVAKEDRDCLVAKEGAISGKISECSRDIKEKEISLGRTDDELREIDSRISALDAKISSLIGERTALEDEKASLNIEAVDRSEIDGLQADMKSLSNEMRTLDSSRKLSRDEYDSKKVQLLSEKRSVSSDIEKIKKFISSIKTSKTGTRCLSCGQFISDEAKHSSEEYYAEQLPELIGKEKILSSAISDINAESEKVIKDIDGKYNDLLKTRVDFESLVASVNQAYAEFSRKMASIDSRLSSVDGQIKALTSSDTLREQRARIEKWKEDTITEMERIKVDIANYKEMHAMVLGDIDVAQFWIEGFGNRGVKSLILDQIVPIISEYANRYASVLMDDEIRIVFETETAIKSGDVRDKFGVKIYVGDLATDYGSFSSGEKRRIDVAILLALQKLIFSRANALCNFAVFDEVFDSLDITGIERTIAILDEESSDKAVFVISHSQEFSGYFDNVISIKKEKGVSRVAF